MKKMISKYTATSLIAILILCFFSGCNNKKNVSVKLDPKNPVTITVWHYYNGNLKNAFDLILSEFNETVGVEKGIIVEGYSYGDLNQLEDAVLSAVNKEVGSSDIPNIFTSYADTAFAFEKMGMLADLGNYFTEGEQNEYVNSYIEEGRIGAEGELKIFPIAKSTEVFMLNKTDWEPFSADTGVKYEDLNTKEGLVNIAEKYYNWTDAKTPDIKEDGKAFYGRDVMANLFIIASMQLGVEIFHVENQTVTINVDDNVMKKIWDTYYVPYINGYFSTYGRFRSDDVKTGEIISLTGSVSSASYFPVEVTVNSETYPIEYIVLPDPYFEGGQAIALQQGAGMVVFESSIEEEYASVLFLKWFTDVETNIEFSAVSGYLPVKNKAYDLELFKSVTKKKGIELNMITMDTIKTAFEIKNNNEFYSNKAFDGALKARRILEYHLSDKAVLDRAAIISLIETGMSREDAVLLYNNDKCFNEWLSSFKAALNAATDK